MNEDLKELLEVIEEAYNKDEIPYSLYSVLVDMVGEINYKYKGKLE